MMPLERRASLQSTKAGRVVDKRHDGARTKDVWHWRFRLRRRHATVQPRCQAHAAV
jgi:hypothetical protein